MEKLFNIIEVWKILKQKQIFEFFPISLTNNLLLVELQPRIIKSSAKSTATVIVKTTKLELIIKLEQLEK